MAQRRSARIRSPTGVVSRARSRHRGARQFDRPPPRFRQRGQRRRGARAAQVIELIDVLTADGKPTGVRKPKNQIHRDGDWHRAAHVWIISPDGRFLLLRSLRKENNPGLWDVSAAGHLSAGESAVEAAMRETFEEIGLALTREDLRFVTTLPQSCVLN